MNTVRFPGRRKPAALRAILSVVTLTGFVLVASVSSLSEGARIALTIAGYTGFVVFGSLALLAWRRGS